MSPLHYRPKSRQAIRFWICAAAFVLVDHGNGSRNASGAFVIGGFDETRGGIGSVEFGGATNSFRAHVAATFPNVAYGSTDTLTSSFLANVDVLLISAVRGSTTPISPLSAAEQAALLGFVNNGGSALLFTDNNIQFETASDSMVQPFGVDADGVIFGSTTGTVTNTAHPVTNGPFGLVTSIAYSSFPGWYSTLGTNAVELARLNPNSQVSLAVISHGVLTPNAGAVVFFADLTIDSGNFTGSTVTLVDNALSYVGAPDPVLSGDYNDDGKVDAADYVVWRKHEGTMTVLPNDPHGGTIGPSQFGTWRSNFGNMGGNGSGATRSGRPAPEPGAIVLLTISGILLSGARTWKV